MPVYKCSFKGDKKIKKIRAAKNRTECLLELTYEGAISPKVSEIADLHGLEYVFLSDLSLNKLKVPVICDFFEQLVFLLRAGLPIYTALESLGKSGDKYIKHLCVKIVPSIVEGLSFDEALAKTGMFSMEVIHQVRAGVESGDLAQSLERIVKSYKKRMELKNKTITAAIYPAFMLVLLVAVMIVMMNFIVPKIAESFEQLGGELPGITLFVISVSDWFVAYTPTMLISIISVIVLIKFLLKKNSNFKEMFDKFYLKLPLLGDLKYKQEIASICLILSSLLICGIPIVQSLGITINTIKNEYLKRKLQRVKRYVEIEGNNLYTALLQTKGFPVLMMQLVDVGERSGDLVSVLEKLAERYETFVESVTKRIITLLEPFVIVVMVVIGGTVVIGMMMPIFTIIEIL